MKWTVKQQPANEMLIKRLSAELNVSMLIASLLVNRGIKTFNEAKVFFRPQISMLHDPFLMKDMDKAVNRLRTAIDNKEKILVYGDYDVDGTTAVSLVYMFLKNYYNELDFYIPDRYSEGYGISFKGIDFAAQNGFTLIIALDCGIKSFDKVEYAKAKGIDFIICDHHRPDEAIPRAAAVLDPKREDCPYPYDELPGCAIGFKLMQAFAEFNKYSTDVLYSYLDLVAIAIAADIVPITGENRILAHFGLKLLNEQKRPGIQAIIEKSRVNRKLNVTDVVFLIAPRINAAGRMKNGREAVQLLIASTPEEAKEHSGILESHNRDRKDMDKTITDQAVEIINGNSSYASRKSTVVYHPDWHKGVIGIVASRLIDKHFYRPTIVLTNSNGKVAGSARSVKDFDVYSAIEKCSDLLEQFGGHMYAAGLTLSPENVEAFIEKFEEAVSSSIQPHMLEREIEIDAEINLSEITERTWRIIKQFEPFGPGNLSPMFASHHVFVQDQFRARIVGNNHLKLSVSQKGCKNELAAIAFQMGENLPKISGRNPFSICYHIEENDFNNQKTIQLNIKDMICRT
jgi:single-stranded-DNA-specific exonuclease